MEDLEFLLHTHTKVLPEAGSIDRSVLRLAEAMARKTKTYEHPEEFVRLPFDPSVYAETVGMVERLWSTQLKYVVVIGIGGSNLGAQAVYEAIRGRWGDIEDKHPLAMFFDTCEPRGLEEGAEFLATHLANMHEIVINIISKSGTTVESAVNADIILDRLIPLFPEIHMRVVVTTDVGSPLAALAHKEGFQMLPIPKPIGGRFSVFTPVGLFPLGLLGVDLEALRTGAQEVYESAIRKKDMHARRATEAIYQAYTKGVTIYDIFFFNPEFESLGKWSRQLFAESLGKEKDLEGRTVRAGILPIISIGSTDLHSMLQLYLAGPKNMFTTMVRTKNFTHTHGVASKFSALAGVKGSTPKEATEAIYRSVIGSYRAHDISVSELILPDLLPYAVGGYMAWFTIVVYFLAGLMHVNPFDQPNVEDYKKATKAALGTAAHA